MITHYRVCGFETPSPHREAELDGRRQGQAKAVHDVELAVWGVPIYGSVVGFHYNMRSLHCMYSAVEAGRHNADSDLQAHGVGVAPPFPL